MQNPSSIVEDMDRMGITKMVLSSSTVLSPTSWAEPLRETFALPNCYPTILGSTRMPPWKAFAGCLLWIPPKRRLPI